MTEHRVAVLLVEDNPNDVDLTLHALKSHLVTSPIEVVRDGAEALEFLFAKGAYTHRRIDDAPKLTLLDLKLPTIEGVEVLRRIKTDPRTQVIPVVMITSSREERDIIESYQLGVNSLVKPVDFEQFKEAVKHLGLYWLLLNQPLAR
jgi:two-component system response regulator